MTPKANTADASIAERLRTEVDRVIQRSFKGLEYLGSPAPAVGVTPRKLLHRRGTLSLYHYQPVCAEVYRVPLLLVMATTNRGYIFDLAPGQSLIEFLLKRGHDIYLIDWNPPSADERRLRFEDYTLDFIPDCVARVKRHAEVEDVSLVGYCMGGVLSTIYAALHPDALQNLVCFTTPIDWKKMTLFQAMTDERHFEVDRLVDTLGNVPAEITIAAFDAQRPQHPGSPLGQHVERHLRRRLPHDGALGRGDPAAAKRILPADRQGADLEEQPVREQASRRRPAG